MSTYEISKSSLLSLKAEILRKQQELVKAKADNEVKIKIIKKNSPLEIRNKGIEARQKNDINEEDEDLLKQSRSKLEAKSVLYDKLSSGKLTDEEKERKKLFLVRFDKKNKSEANDVLLSDSDEPPDKYPESDEHCYHSDEDDTAKNPGDKWVDYIDCLGRTRRCLQKDLEYLKAKDQDLKKTVEAKEKNEPSKPELDNSKITHTNAEDASIAEVEDKNKITQESELLSSDMRRELLRQQWEKELEELQNKSDIHYQDILFGEARTHGVGYYGFSKDMEERAKQQEALKKLRDETEQKQKRAQELKAIREKQLGARVKAAKNRKRARLGLPPEEEDTEEPPQPEVTEEEKKKQDEFKQKEDEKEKLLESARKRHLRPWDIGKEGVKEHYEMSQDEWVEKKRSERPEEFAPPVTYRKEFRSTVKSSHVQDTDKSLNFTSKKVPYNISRENSQHMNGHNQKRNINPYKTSTTNFEEIQQDVSREPTPIVNLCEESDYTDHLLRDYDKVKQNTKQTDLYSSESSDSDDDRRKRGGVEIAPPCTIDYYGPSHSKKSRNNPSANNIQDSIEAGLRFLRHQVEEKEKSTKHPREMYLS